jgi:mannitol PTS system EIICBA or EIICB component
MSTAIPAPTGTATRGWRASVQRFGGFLAGMVIPNIGAFIAWGLITAFFIPTGWTPNEDLAQLVGPMIFFLLPILIGYTGGHLVHGQRGAVVGAIATAGVAIGGFVGTEVGGELVQTPMFLGAMIAGPLGGWLIKQFDRSVEGKIRTGFEMLVGNFSAGILGAILAILGYLAIGPIVAVVSSAAGDAVDFLVDNTLLPLASIIVPRLSPPPIRSRIPHGISFASSHVSSVDPPRLPLGSSRNRGR